MPQIELPQKFTEGFASRSEHDEHQGDPFECGLFRILPPPLQEVSRCNPHLMEYLHMIPIDEIGIPQYYPELYRNLLDLKQRNLVYPTSSNTLVHVWSSPDEERDMYIPIEPSLMVELNGKLTAVEERLIGYVERFASLDTPANKEQALLVVLSEICDVTTSGNQTPPKSRSGGLFSNDHGGKIRVTPREFEAICYLIVREKVGLGILEPFKRDMYIEDISCSGLGPIFLEHKIFKSMKTALCFNDHDDLDQFVLRLSERIQKPVTMRNPIVDAMMPDGSRINIVYGRDVSQRGSNFTIRQFTDIPISVMELIEFGTMDYTMAAYLSIVLEDGMNIFVAGETASGKTTLLNAITTFVPATAKIVSIEETPEVNVPHPNWLREVAKAGKKGETGPDVTMFDLLKAALRQRPNLIIIGEIRGEEGAVAFQAMQTGHAVMATFHAASVEKLIQRLTGDPINVPKAYIDNLNVVIIQSAVKLPGGKIGRRAISISEIVGFDPPTNTFTIVEIFRWNPLDDTFEFLGDQNSYLLEEKIAPRRGMAGVNTRQIYVLLQRRATILRRLHQERGVKGYYELLKVIARAQREGLF